MSQFCPQVNDEVTSAKCNACNTDLVRRTGFCCKYINCLTTCDYKGKDTCATYLQKVFEKSP